MAREKQITGTDSGLTERERQLGVAQRIARLGSWSWNVGDDHVTWSEELYRIYGLEPHGFGSSFNSYLDCVHPDDRARVQSQIMQTIRTGEPFDFEERILRPDGSERILRSTGEATCDDEGNVIQLIGVCQDITEIKRTELALQQAQAELEERVAARTGELAERTRELARAEQSFRAIVEASPVPLLLSRLNDGIVLYANDRLEALIGVPPGGLTGRKTPEFYYDLSDRPKMVEAVRKQGYVRDLELRIKREDGSPIWVSITGQSLNFDGQPALATAFIDITERVETKQTLLLQKTLLEAQGEASIDGILVVSEDGKILSYNQRFVELWNIPPEVVDSKSDEAAIQSVLDQLVDPAAFLDRIDHLYKHPRQTARDEIELRDGRVFDRYSAPVISSAGDYYGRIWFFRDMTLQKRHAEELNQSRLDAERAREQANQYAANLEQSLEMLRTTQARLVQQEKLASLGQLTAGIAHEIKNPLNFVNNFAELSKELADDLIKAVENGEDITDLVHDLKQNAEHIAKHGRRADAIVNSMMQHAAGRKGRHQPTELNALVKEYMHLSMHGKQTQLSNFEVNVECTLDDEIGTIEIIPQEIGRVLLNLVDNALDAVYELKKRKKEYAPKIVVSTRKLAGSVEIRVVDNGPGIPDQVRDRVFEPFFTTKPAGKGTGLGLSLSYDIITKGHSGALILESEEGKGATFIVTLPG